MLKEDKTHVLFLAQSIVDDAGQYVLQATNRMGKVLSKTELIVKCNTYKMFLN